MKTSAEWLKEYNITILDYDGWDRKNLDYSFNVELISKEEFMKRLLVSTVIIH